MAIVAPMAAMALLLLTEAMSVSHGQLQVGFYSDSCPDAEDIVTAAVQDAAGSDPTILPALLRLQFHDCFVRVRDVILFELGGALARRLLTVFCSGRCASRRGVAWRAGVRRVGADTERAERRGGEQQQAPGAAWAGRRGRGQGGARGPMPRRRLLRRHHRARRARRHRHDGRAVVRRADGAARRAGLQPPRRRRASGRRRLHPGAPLQVLRQRPRRPRPRPPHSGAHDRHDGVLLREGQAVQLPSPRRRRRVRPVHPGGVPDGAEGAVRAGRLQHARRARPRQRARLRRLHPPQHPLGPRGHRLRRRARRQQRHTRARHGLPRRRVAQVRAGLRRRHGEDGHHRRAHRRRRRGQGRVLPVQHRLIDRSIGRTLYISSERSNRFKNSTNEMINTP